VVTRGRCFLFEDITIMPSLDTCEPEVIRALAKDGWTIIYHPLSVKTAETNLYIDLMLAASDGRRIIVEIKCFLESRTELTEVYRAFGQYLIYRAALELDEKTVPLYLAVPLSSYLTVFQCAIVQKAMRDANIRLVVIDLTTEEVVTWIP
jgi:hypothetical protein